MLIPPLNWGLVERGLSRSGMTAAINLPFMQRQQLRTIVFLDTDEDEEEHEEAARGLDQDTLRFIAENNINLIQLGGATKETSDQAGGAQAQASAGKDARDAKPSQHARWKPTSEDLVLATLNLVLDPRTYPLHLMCSSSGRHRTGVVVGCFRKLQRWTLSSIFAEYRRYAGSSRGAVDENNQLGMNEQFIELFDIDLVSHTIQQRSLQKHLKQINVGITGANGGGGSASGAGTTKEDPSGAPAQSKKASSSASSQSKLQLQSTPAASPSAVRQSSIGSASSPILPPDSLRAVPDSLESAATAALGTPLPDPSSATKLTQS